MDITNTRRELTHQLNNPRNIVELIHQLKSFGVPDSEYDKYVQRFLENKARKKRIPVHGTFELTPLCNFDCKMCYVHLKSTQFNQNQLLPVQIWKTLITDSCKAGMRTASLTGGECLTYPGFDEVYLFLREKGVRSAILSNGYLIDKKRIDFFKEYPPEKIQITLYGASDDSYEQVTGQRAFKTVYKNICMLKDANINVTIGITPNKRMGNMYELLDIVDNLGVPYNVNSALITPRINTGRDKQDATIEQYIEILRYANQLKKTHIEPVDPLELPDENHCGSEKYGLRCGGGRSGFTIRYDGTMSTCAALEDISSNTLKIGFLDAWREVVKLADQYPLPAECIDCVYSASCYHCVAMHRDAPSIGHCNPDVCARIKKMISAGVVPFIKSKQKYGYE